MANTIRQPPTTLAQFEALTWEEKRKLKRDLPDIYWRFIEVIRGKEN